uniref:DUF393 domain-containing protein n=1 Tax=Entomoneis paludosa TaxID=265537 RepID=A0A7S2YNE8_9STRA|mmetsp:Transcript_39855/g.82880  ORF Transcript_39855/g.82880 Transcript_39855/m.82880 type:complete len:202 (+) Transcript_39855:149-754(+)
MDSRTFSFLLLLGLLGLGHVVGLTGPSLNRPAWSLSSSTKRSTLLEATTSSTTTTSESTTANAPLPENVILYDGVCNFCNSWVDILLRVDFQQKFRFAPLQSTTGQKLLVKIGKEANDISSVVLVQQDGAQYFDKSQCVLKVVEELGPGADILARIARQIVPLEFRDDIYDMVAENRYNLMGKRDECRCSDPEFADRFLFD